MDEWTWLRSMALRIGAGGGARLARALDDWTEKHADWLGLDDAKTWAEALAVFAGARAPGPSPHVMQVTAAVAEALALDGGEAALLGWMVAIDRLPRVAALAGAWADGGGDLPVLIGELTGAGSVDAERVVRRCAAVRLGLVAFRADRQGRVMVDIRWSLERVLDRAAADRGSVVAALAGPTQRARLGRADFAHVGDFDFLVRLLAGAVRERAGGINVLVHGPPGTGKTELARTLAAAAGLALHAVGEADEDGDEPSRWDRVCALQLAHRVTAPAGGAVLLFDEMEDLIGDARPTGGDFMAGRQGSKVFVNRMLEANAVPVIWTTNALGNVDDAILRRMTFVLKLDLPSPATGRRIAARVAAEEGVARDPRVEALLDRAPEASTVLRVAARAARLAGEEDGGARSAEALVRALRGADTPPSVWTGLDLSLFESERPIEPVFAAAAGAGATDLSMLLTGPPGTGKTALAHHLARVLDRPLVVKRASDLLSKWVGGTERAIAGAFAEARERGGVLLFDEADSLLFDRTTARTSWEVGQVNELLTWLDHHPLPVVAATNHPAKLDPATLRRFVFKLELKALGPVRAAEAFARFFGRPAPASLAEVANLTPGDFAVVARQLRWTPAASAEELVERLRLEAAAKPEGGGRIGF